MSNYTPVVSYGPKDSLTHGDPNKALKGVQLDAEFAAIATAVSSKQDSSVSSSSFTATFTGGISTTATVKYVTNGTIAVLYFPTDVVQSSASVSSIIMSGIPGAIIPAVIQVVPIVGIRSDIDVVSAGLAGVATLNHSGNFVFQRFKVTGNVVQDAGGFTAGTYIRGINSGTSLTYGLT